MSRLFRIELWVVGLLLLAAQPAFAQGGGRVVQYAPDVSKFPGVGLTFEVYDAQGNFLNDLAQGEVQVNENDQPVQVDMLSRLQPGIHAIMAFNVAPGMATAAANNPNRFEQVKKAVEGWVQRQPGSAQNEYSLVTNAGPQATRVGSPQQLADALAAYTPDLSKTQPSLTSLTLALDLASDPSRRPDSKRAILYITAPLPDTAQTALPNLGERASQLGVRISVWLVLPAPAQERSAKALNELAQSTGGQFLTFSGTESLPTPELYFQQLRYQYRVSYTSAARQNGTQRVKLSIARSGISAPPEQKYTLNLLPPNPFFLSPPSHVQRAWAEPDSSGKSVLSPKEIDLQAIVEFPDGLRRAIKASRLFVDGKLAYEMTVDPFNPLVWSLADYTSSGRHVLRVEMEDILGLSHSSIEIPVEVEVEAAPAFGLAALIETVRPYLPWGGLVGVAVLVVLGGLTGLRALRARLGRQLPRPAARVEHAVSRLRADIPAPARPRPFANPNAPARLVRVAENSLKLPGESIAIGQDEIRLGSDPRQADCVLDSPAVDGLHARIMRGAEGRFIICDAGSVAGTWVNYLLVPPEGQALEHGDQVNLGGEVFRFELKNPPAPRQARVTSLQEEA